MRQIAFRAWDKNSNSMLTGFFFLNSAIIVPPWYNKKKTDLEFMQFTGLKDKNGKEIYEGDIIAIQRTDGSTIGFGEVRWIRDGFGLNWDVKTAKVRREKDLDCLPANLGSAGSPWIIIGNIHENAELLKANSEV